MDNQKMNMYKDFIEDVQIFSNIKNNENYKRNLILNVELLVKADIKSYEEFKQSKINFGIFSYKELTYFNRIKDEQYFELISETYGAVMDSKNRPKYFGDTPEEVMIPKR